MIHLYDFANKTKVKINT